MPISALESKKTSGSRDNLHINDWKEVEEKLE